MISGQQSCSAAHDSDGENISESETKSIAVIINLQVYQYRLAPIFVVIALFSMAEIESVYTVTMGTRLSVLSKR